MFRRLSTDHLRYLLIAVIFILTTPFLFGFEATKNITIKYDNKVKKVATTSKIPKLIILNAGIKLQPGDGWRFEHGHKKLEDGCVLEVVRAVPFTVTYNGQKKQFKSSKETVGEALKSVGLNVKKNKMYPHAHEKFHEGMNIFLVNEKESMHLADTVIKPSVKYVDDKNLAAGVEKVVKPGKPGKAKIVSRVYKDVFDKHVTEEIGRVVVEPAEPAIVHKGMARSVKTPQGYKRYKKLLTCEATAYTHTGDPTATGIMPYVGVVAVDPRYIPLGTKMYIPGYGVAIAADTGGAIVRNIIDLFMDTERECINWGRRNVQVYILED